MEKRHGEEDKTIEHVIEDKEKEEDHTRKFRWETLAITVGLVLNLIFTLLHSYIKNKKSGLGRSHVSLP